MRSFTRRVLLPLLACLALAGVALASEPSSGKVSKAAPSVKWTGSLTEPYAGGYVPFFANGGSADTPCQAPSCDRFELEVTDGPANLDFLLTMTSIEGGFDTIRIIKPDGSVVYVADQADGPLKTRIKNAANGKYLVDVTSGSKTQATYEASATLAVATAAPAPSATPAPVPAPAPMAPAPVTLTVTAPKGLSAKKLNKAKKLALTINTNHDAALRATLKRGKKAVAAGGGRINGTGKIVIKLKGKLKAGAHTIVVVASDGTSQVSKTVKLKLAR
jgi:hypothetical protein